MEKGDKKYPVMEKITAAKEPRSGFNGRVKRSWQFLTGPFVVYI
jgi:hypothetical protein